MKWSTFLASNLPGSMRFRQPPHNDAVGIDDGGALDYRDFHHRPAQTFRTSVSTPALRLRCHANYGDELLPLLLERVACLAADLKIIVHNNFVFEDSGCKSCDCLSFGPAWLLGQEACVQQKRRPCMP